MHYTNATLWRRIAAGFRPRHRRVYLTAALLLLACTQGARARDPQFSGARYIIETIETATFYVGRQGRLNLVLLDRDGNRHNAPFNLKTTITITTLDTLEEAKSSLKSRKAVPPTSSKRMITLARGQQVAQATLTHPRGEEDEVVYFVSNQPGTLHIFAECDNVATGERVVVVLQSRAAGESVAPEQPSVQPGVRFLKAAWQEEVSANYKLDIQPRRGPEIQSDKGDQVSYFSALLLSARGNHNEVAPHDITIIFQVEEGYASFSPSTLTIPRNEALTLKTTQLRTRPGGRIKISASAVGKVNNSRVIPVTREYDFKPGVHSTSLSLHKQRERAYANGLDAVEIQVEALQDGQAIAPEQEGMDERRIRLRLLGDSRGVKFEDGKGEIVIPKGQVAGSIKLFSTRPVSDLRVVADSFNGLSTSINAGAEGLPISFSFPWLQLLCAMAGGVMFPLLSQQWGLRLAQGVMLGVLLFGLALFGALLSDPQNLGPISFTLTKLPTESTLASFILGFMGSLFLLFIFKWRGWQQAAAVPSATPPHATTRERHRAPTDDVRADAPVETAGSGAGSRMRGD